MKKKREEEEEAEAEEGDDDDDDFELDSTQREIRNRNAKMMREGGEIRTKYTSFLDQLKPPEPDEVVLRRPFRPVKEGQALQTGARRRFPFPFVLSSMIF